MIFDISVEEIKGRATLPWIVVLTASDKTIECHVKTKDKAMTLADKFQKRGWTKVPPAHRFLKYLRSVDEEH
jgi:hypothetical protein